MIALQKRKKNQYNNPRIYLHTVRAHKMYTLLQYRLVTIVTNNSIIQNTIIYTKVQCIFNKVYPLHTTRVTARSVRVRHLVS